MRGSHSDEEAAVLDVAPSGLSSGSSIDASFSGLVCVPTHFFTTTPVVLTRLVLSFNQLTELPDAICGLHCLKELEISGNLLQRLPRLPATLQQLYCTENRISFPPTSLMPLQGLHLLCLDKNPVPVCARNFFTDAGVAKWRSQLVPRALREHPCSRVVGVLLKRRGDFRMLPKDMARMVAQAVWHTRYDVVWVVKSASSKACVIS